MLYCRHFDSVEGIVWCSICRGKEKVKTTPPPQVQKERMAARIDAGEGYWANDRIKARQKSEMLPCNSCGGRGEHFPEQRMCYGCQERQLLRNARDIRVWKLLLQHSAEDEDDKQMGVFSAAIAGDRSARITHTAFDGLYPDDPPLNCAVPES